MCESYTAITTEASPLSFWLHRTLVTPANIKLEIPAVAAKWHGKNDEMHRPTVAAIGCTKEKLETVNGLDQGERAVVTRPAPGHPLGPQAGQEVLKDLERVGSTKGPSRTRIPQRSPACLGADAAEDPACQLAT